MSTNRLSLCPAAEDDIDFLRLLYTDTRREEVAKWGWPVAQQQVFLNMQFQAQRQSYRAVYANALDQIIHFDGSAIGRLMIAEETAALYLVDIALLSAYRNRGFGTELLRALQRDCERQSLVLKLQVLAGNPAIRLYERLGFVRQSGDPMYSHMEWVPSPQLETN